MKLRYYAAFITWLLTALLMIAGMWVWTKMDILEIWVVTWMFSSIVPMAVMAFTEQEEGKARKDRDRRFRIYTLTEEQDYGRKIS